MTIMPCPAPTEQTVHDIIAEVKDHAQAGTLTPQMLALGVMAMQDWLQYLDNLIDADLQPSIGRTFEELDQITEGKSND